MNKWIAEFELEDGDTMPEHMDLEYKVAKFDFHCRPKEPCDDVVSRQTAIDAFERFIHELGIEDEPYNYGEMALSVKNVPPVNPQPKTGHWIECMPGGAEEWCYKCSECNFWKYKKSINLSKFKFCPNCGAKMVDSQESEG